MSETKPVKSGIAGGLLKLRRLVASFTNHSIYWKNSGWSITRIVNLQLDRTRITFFQGKTDFQDMFPAVRIWCTSTKRKLAALDDILISVRAPVGAVNICDQKSIFGRGLAAIRPLPQLDGKFLYYDLKANERQIAALGTGSTIKAITQHTVKNIEVPFLPLDDQIRIAHRLGKVGGQIAQRKKHLQQLDGLLKIVFLAMFSDPVRNEMGWDLTTIGDLASEVKYGTSASAKDGQYKYRRMNNITWSGCWDFGNLKYVDTDDGDFEK
jgi:restriction endonuclease S subunit